MKKPVVLTLALASAALAFAPAANAQVKSAPVAADLSSHPGDDTVILKNGGMVRGTVVAIDPGREVTIMVLGSNEQRIIPWGEVERVDRGAAHRGPPPPPIAPPQVEGEMAPTAPGVGAPRIHIDADNPNVQLHEVTMQIAVVGSGGSAYGMMSRPVCTAPCDRVVDGRQGHQFYFAGEGVPASGRFLLMDQGGALNAHVEAGSTGARGGGFAMIVVGGVGLITGASLVLTGALVSNTGFDGKKSSSSLPTVGAVSALAGAGLLVGGIVLIMSSGRTKFTLEPAQAGMNQKTVRPMLTAQGAGFTF